MTGLKRVAREVPLLIAWLILSVILWGWIFSLVTDTTPDKKLTLAVDASVTDRTACAGALEELLPEGLKMAKVYPFSYAMMDTSLLEACDLYIIPESGLEEYADWLAPVPDALADAYECGQYGVVFSGYSEYINYYPEGETFYLCVGAQSVHSDVAVQCAIRLLENSKEGQR